MYGYIMIAYGIIYALLGVLVMAGMLQGLMPGYESGEMLIMVLAFVVAILAIICGFACIKGNNGMASVLWAHLCDRGADLSRLRTDQPGCIQSV